MELVLVQTIAAISVGKMGMLQLHQASNKLVTWENVINSAQSSHFPTHATCEVVELQLVHEIVRKFNLVDSTGCACRS